MLHQEDIIKIVLEEGLYIHKSLGPGLLEKVYQTCLAYRLRKSGFFVEEEKAVPVIFEDIKMDCGYRADIIVEKSVVIETKSVDALIDIHTAQLLTQLKFLNIRHGLLLNFNVVLFKSGIKRVLNGY
jgi:GxxExxY protein